MKVIVQYFYVVLFIMLYKVVLTFKSVDETPVGDHLNEGYWAVLSCGTVFYAVQGGSPFKSVDETLAWPFKFKLFNNTFTWYYLLVVEVDSLLSLRTDSWFQETVTCWNCTRSMFALISFSGILMKGESSAQFIWSDFPCCNLRAASSNRPLWSMAITWKNNIYFIKKPAALKSFLYERRIKFSKSVRMTRVTPRHGLKELRHGFLIVKSLAKIFEVRCL